MKEIFTAAALIAVLSLCRCGPAPLSGGVTDTGNIRVSAVIYQDDGTLAAGVPVILRSSDFLGEVDGIKEEDPKGKFETVTDDSGRFCIESIEAGSYLIEVNDGENAATLLSINVPLSVELDTSIILADTLKPFASIKGHIDAGSSAPLFCQIYGLERISAVDASGNFEFSDLPEGTYRLRIISADSLFTPVILNDISVLSDEVLNLPFISWSFSKRLYLNTTSSGADVAESVTGFPVLVRLNSTNFDFESADSAGADLRFTNPEGIPVPHEIEHWDKNAQTASIWVKVDTIQGNNNTQFINMFWGNPGAAGESESGAVFDTSDGFQGIYHFSDFESGKTADATYNRYDGTVSSVNSTPGIAGSAGEFDELSSYITLTGTAGGKLNFPEDGNYTVSAWIYAFDYPSDRFIVGKGNYQYHLKIKDEMWYFVEYSGEPAVGWESTNFSAAAMEWQHVAGVKNGNSQYLYVNGICVDSTSETLTGDSVRITEYDVEIGRRTDPLRVDYQPFYGRMDEVRLCNVSRGPDWLKLSYMNQKEDDALVRFE